MTGAGYGGPGAARLAGSGVGEVFPGLLLLPLALLVLGVRFQVLFGPLARSAAMFVLAVTD